MFKDKFKEIHEYCKDIIAISFIGKDGITVANSTDSVKNEEFSIELSEIINSSENFWGYREDNLDEQVYHSEENTILIRKISEFYFLILIMKPKANIGKARFMIRKNLLWFQKEIQ